MKKKKQVKEERVTKADLRLEREVLEVVEKVKKERRRKSRSVKLTGFKF